MPMRPSCIVCCSDCDTNGLFTSCQHFLCTKCSSKTPAGQCPRCQKPCQVVRLGAPNFPKEVRERIMADPSRMMQGATGVADFQRRHEQETIKRLKELLQHFHTNLGQMGPAMAEMKKEIAKLRQENEDLKSQLLEAQQNMQQQRRHSAFAPPSPGSLSAAFADINNQKRPRSVSLADMPRPRSPMQLTDYIFSAPTPAPTGGIGGGGASDPKFVMTTPAVGYPVAPRDGAHSSHSSMTRTLPGLLPNRGLLVHSSSGQSESFVPPRLFNH